MLPCKVVILAPSRSDEALATGSVALVPTCLFSNKPAGPHAWPLLSSHSWINSLPQIRHRSDMSTKPVARRTTLGVDVAKNARKIDDGCVEATKWRVRVLIVCTKSRNVESVSRSTVLCD